MTTGGGGLYFGKALQNSGEKKMEGEKKMLPFVRFWVALGQTTCTMFFGVNSLIFVDAISSSFDREHLGRDHPHESVEK